MYGNLRTLVSEADSSIAAIHSIQHEKDWFDNPIETTGQFSGVVIDARKEEVLILAPTEAIETADSLEVAFSDSAVLPGAVKQTDSRMGLTMIRVDATSLDDAQFEDKTGKTGKFLWGQTGRSGYIHGFTGRYGTLQQLWFHFLYS